MVKVVKESFNGNSLLLLLLIALSTWTIKSVSDLKETVAVLVSRQGAAEARITTNEANVHRLELKSP